MKISKTENNFASVAITFCLIGLALLISVMVWRQQINSHPAFQKTVVAASSDVTIASIAATAPAVTVASSSTVPDKVLQEITQDPRNLIGQPAVNDAPPLSPSIKFLYTLDNPNLFPTQR
jgi:hypothetical protein